MSKVPGIHIQLSIKIYILYILLEMLWFNVIAMKDAWFCFFLMNINCVLFKLRWIIFVFSYFSYPQYYFGTRCNSHTRFPGRHGEWLFSRILHNHLGCDLFAGLKSFAILKWGIIFKCMEPFSWHLSILCSLLCYSKGNCVNFWLLILVGFTHFSLKILK